MNQFWEKIQELNCRDKRTDDYNTTNVALLTDVRQSEQPLPHELCTRYRAELRFGMESWLTDLEAATDARNRVKERLLEQICHHFYEQQTNLVRMALYAVEDGDRDEARRQLVRCLETMRP